MGFFNTIKEVITNKPSTLNEPKYIKEFTVYNRQIEELKELLKSSDDEIAKSINEEIKLCTYGMYGEKNVAYELEHCNMPILILHDLYLKYKNKTAQVDFVVIAQRFILIIECKNMVGDIEVDNNGNFIRIFKGSNGKRYKKEGMYSPITQNEKHVNLIKEIIDNEFKSRCNTLVKHCVVLANDKSILNDKYASKEIKQKIIKYDQLINKMKDLNEANKNGAWLTEEGMYKVAGLLMKYNSENTNDYTAKYKDMITNINEEEKAVNEEIQKEVTQNDIKEEVIKQQADEEKIAIESTEIYQELKKYRYNKSVEEKNKPYFIFTNQMLEDIIGANPRTMEELIKIKGFGPKKCEIYGSDILEIVNRFNRKTNI